MQRMRDVDADTAALVSKLRTQVQKNPLAAGWPDWAKTFRVGEVAVHKNFGEMLVVTPEGKHHVYFNGLKFVDSKPVDID
mgnify:CR=1 FL=1